MQVLPELIRTLNNGFLKTQVRIERKANQCQPIDDDIRECVEWGAKLANMMGREIASIEEARTMLNTPLKQEA